MGMTVSYVISFWMFLGVCVRNSLGVWGCVQARAQWSTEEDAHIRPGHHWMCEFGDDGNDTSCEKQFNFDHHKCEDFRGTRFYNKDSALVIKR